MKTLSLVAKTPRFDGGDAGRIARELYGLVGTVRPLPSERDRNFLVSTGSGDRFVLKIANGEEGDSLVALQQAALEHVARVFELSPHVVAARDGARSHRVPDPDGVVHTVWCVGYLEGEPLARVRRHTPELVRDFGRRAAQLSLALSGFDHPALRRELHWDIAGARTTVELLLPRVSDATAAANIERVLAAYDRHTAAHLAALPRRAVHGDLNDYNVLVRREPRAGVAEYRVSGILDFGDVMHSYAAAEAATAVAYLMLGKRDPLSVATRFVKAFHADLPLQESEIAAVFGFACMRLCLSACIGEVQHRENPSNDYLTISAQPVRHTLGLLSRIPFGFAEAALRDACGLEPIPRSTSVGRWLRSKTHECAPVLGFQLGTEPAISLDLGVGSSLVSGDALLNTEPYLTERIFSRMRDFNVRVSIGRYAEHRLLYTAPFYSVSGENREERRTLHIGLDLFAAAGTPVYAPLPATVHAFADNAAPQDYGPVVILRHETETGTEFFTLYGHLSRESLRDLHVGKKLEQGQRFAALGIPAENVGWTPHLHLQIITDLLEFGTDFPGVGDSRWRNVWLSLSPDPNLLAGIPASTLGSPPQAREEILASRRSRMGANVKLGYRVPLRIERGWMQHLYDETGRKYLDAFNNVPHVGHCHPRVVEAVSRQLALVNTNTRYLTGIVPQYVERLLETFPRPLEVCFLVNSGSEANELAIRIAREHTGRKHTIVLEHAYHGNTVAAIDLSPYKHGGPGGHGAPEWVHTVPQPDDYRGPYKRGSPDAGASYARHVADLVEGGAMDGKPCAFLAETCPSVGGQILPPDGYFAEVYGHVRRAGGVCIADEVQTGFGRMGEAFWAFELYGVIPDIVVLGKPIANGYPMGAVVTTRAIADSFANGMEYFSTFGGSTVSCAAGLAVLDVLRDERLQERARGTGTTLRDGLDLLKLRHNLVGDVRGSGLFWGVELVRDRRSLEAAGAEAEYVAERMREAGILIGTDGPYHNVLKIRPPMQFTSDDARLLVAMLDEVLGEVASPDV